VEAAQAMPSTSAHQLLSSAREAFVDGLSLAAGAGALVLLATAIAAWFMLRNQRLDSAP
jgi:DHA2 family multidrug resistance protein-like MFS transporter